MHPNTLMNGPDDGQMRYTKFYMIMFSFVRTWEHQRTEWSSRLWRASVVGDFGDASGVYDVSGIW